MTSGRECARIPRNRMNDATTRDGRAAGGPLRKWGELTRILAIRNLKIRYKGSALGFFWSLLTPAATILMYAVFAHILKFGGGDGYLPFLVTGIVVWGFTAGTLNDSLFSIAANANLVKKVYFPRAILPLSTTLANAVNFLLTLVPLLLYLAIAGRLRLGHAGWLVPALALHFALALGISYLVSTLNVFFRDTQHVVGIGQLAWFFLTPVFYYPAMQVSAAPLPDAWRGLVYLNPMTGILAMYRRGLLGLELVPGPESLAAWGAPAAAAPSAWWLAASAASVALVFVLGLVALRRGDRDFGDVL